MSKQLENPFDIDGKDGKAIVTHTGLDPLDWSLFAKQAGLRGTPITAEELVNRQFDIMRAKQFASSFEGQDHVWFCIVRPVDQDELFEVALGGQAVVEILDAYSKSGLENPLRVKLGFIKQGKYGGYYTFE